MRKRLPIYVALVMLATLGIAGQTSATGADGDCACGETIWGIQRGVDVPFIYGIDLSTNTATFVADTDKNDALTNFPNGVAFDVPSNRLFYAERVAGSVSLLHFYDFAGNHVLAGELSGVVAGATIHDGSYYYIPQGTGDLYRATLQPDGTIASDTLIKSNVSGVGSGYGFGDMVITADGSTMYVSAGTGGVNQFFSIDLNGNNYNLISTETALLQLAYGVGDVLYAHNAGSGMFYTMDTATGALTEIGTVTGSETGVFTDLASFQTCDCEDEDECPLPTLDFEGQDAGTIIDGEYVPGISITTNDPANHPAMIFDTGNPTGEDDDLGTPNTDFGGPGIGAGGAEGTPGANSQAHDKVLILSEDRSTVDPDDDDGGGTITLTFDRARPVYAVEILDIDTDEGGSVTANLAEGGQVVVSFDNLGNNSYQKVVLDAQGVSSLDVTFSSSAALASVIFCPPCEESAAIWGIQRGVDVPFIYGIDLSTNTATFVADTDKNDALTNFPNGVAFDVPSNRLFYAERVAGSVSLLHFYDFAGNHVLAGELSGVVAGATIHDGSYYYIPQGTGDLYRATLQPDGTIASDTLIKSNVSGVGSGYGFGDMVITADGSTMYVSAGTGGVNQFFSIDLNGNNYNLISTETALLQLAYGVGDVLYAHNAGSGMFYTMDTATGALTEIGTVTGSETGVFTDLASFQTCILPEQRRR